MRNTFFGGRGEDRGFDEAGFGGDFGRGRRCGRHGRRGGRGSSEDFGVDGDDLRGAMRARMMAVMAGGRDFGGRGFEAMGREFLRRASVRGFGGGFGGMGGGFGGGGFPGGFGGFGDDGRDGRGGGRGAGRGGRRRRLFDQAELQSLLLSLIAQGPRHGYELIREIEALSGGEYAPSPGVVYPALTYMEESGLIAQVQGEGARKAFDVTDEGRAQVMTDEKKAAELRARLESMASVRAQVDPAPVRRAIHGLRSAVIERLSKGEPDRETILQIAEAIDEVTRRIERLDV
ncbi:PadR family transcriptional regulator [Novosphingobium sp. 9]|uniref:PadR family transcriptional regulator n=1 Tax=Novosphingobium sp. 9 TaxID=2025349 RepID=UPI0021B4FD81|nr:PadR family transcriptional regulator [Novosphingobium sp. 9]